MDRLRKEVGAEKETTKGCSIINHLQKKPEEIE